MRPTSATHQLKAVSRSLSSLLQRIRLGHAHRQVPDPTNYSHALGYADSAPRIEQVEQVRAFQRQLIRGQQRESLLLRRARFLVGQQRPGLFKQLLRLRLVRIKVLPEL